MRFEGKTVIVTGAGRGIGFEIAQEFVREGASVVLAEIDDQTGPDAVGRLALF